MKNYLKEFFHRGLMFGGFGPIVVGIVFFINDLSGVEFILNGAQILLAIASTYILAFVQAGATVFNQIEDWPITKSLFFHFLSIYLVYVGCYLLNSWIPFNLNIILIFTAIFVFVYFVVWLTVYLCVKHYTKKLNDKIK